MLAFFIGVDVIVLDYAGCHWINGRQRDVMTKLIGAFITLVLVAFALAPFVSAVSLAVEEPMTITVSGFDKDGEPEIRAGEDGGLEIMFNFMPPSNGAPDSYASPLFDTFENVLTKELGVEVLREDRELFLIPKPSAGTAERLKAYLESFWINSWPNFRDQKK